MVTAAVFQFSKKKKKVGTNKKGKAIAKRVLGD